MTDRDTEKIENEKSLIECIQALFKSIDNKTYSVELKDLFFRQVENKSQLPDKTVDDVIIKFIECLIYIAFSDSDEAISFKAVQTLFRFLKTDVQVFMCFRPNKLTIRKLKLDKYILNLSVITTKIKRAEIHRIWIDTEDILGRLDGAESNIKQNMSNTGAGFGEVFAYIDKINKQFQTYQKEANEKLNYLNEVLKQKNEESERSRTSLLEKESKTESQVNVLQAKIDKLEKEIKQKEKEAKLKEAKEQGSPKLTDVQEKSENQSSKGALPQQQDGDSNNPGNLLYIKEIYDRLEETKKQLLIKIAKIDSEMTLFKSQKQTGPDDTVADNLIKSVNILSERVDLIESKRQPGLDFLQKYDRFDEEYETLKLKVQGLEDLKDTQEFQDKKVETFNQELQVIKDFLRNQGNQNDNVENVTVHMNQMKKEISFELEKLGTFIQEYVNEQAKIRIKQIKRLDAQAKDKMTEFEWFIRNIDFISPSIPGDLIQWTKDTLADNENNQNKVMLSTNSHDSDVIITLLSLIKQSSSTQNQQIRQSLTSYLLFLEVLLMSDPNLDKALHMDIYKLLFEVIAGDENFTLEEKKISLRSISACLRKDKAIQQLIKSKYYMGIIIEIFKKPWDEEAVIFLTNFFRIAFIFHSDLHLNQISMVEVSKQLFNNTKQYSYSEVLVEDTLLALKSFTQIEDNLDLIDDPKCYDYIIELALKSQSKLKSLAVTILKNSKKKASLGGYFARQGYSDLI